MPFALSLGETYLELAAETGGSVSVFRVGDIDVLRPAPPQSDRAIDPRLYAAFPMVPFVGRIHNGRLLHEGCEIRLPANMPPEQHAIHGHGWQESWEVTRANSKQLTLLYRHAANVWPWDYIAAQTFVLEDQALSLNMSVTNLSEEAMPAGLGWHPYFPREGARCRVPTTHEWFPNAATGENIPQSILPDADLSRTSIVSELSLDTTFSVDPEPVQLTWPTHSVTISSDPVFSHATMFVPNGEDYFCVEPVTQAPNAMNSTLASEITGARYLATRETLSGRIRLVVDL